MIHRSKSVVLRIWLDPFLNVGIAAGVWRVREHAGDKVPRCSHKDVAVVGSIADPWYRA
jgi:hypothetical protein